MSPGQSTTILDDAVNQLKSIARQYAYIHTIFSVCLFACSREDGAHVWQKSDFEGLPFTKDSFTFIDYRC